MEFEAAYRRIGEHPNRHLVLYNIARCHELLFHYDEALTFYRRYLTEGGADADGRDEVEATLRTLENLLATVEVRVEGPGGELWVDGHLVGEAPGTVSVTAGRHVIEARADGYVPAAREVETPARREVTVVLVMVAVGGDEFEGLHPAFFGTAVGLAMASGVTSAIFGLRAIAARNGVDERLADPRERWTLEQSDIDEIGQLALAADLFLGGALLFAATAAVLALLTDWGGDDDEEPSAALEGLGLRVRY